MILIAYDGSSDAQAAIDRAASLSPSAKATVMTVWEPFVDSVTRTGSLGLGAGIGVEMGSITTYADAEKLDAIKKHRAMTVADAGTQRAVAAGLEAQPRCETEHGDVATTILAVAEEMDADVIVMGTRGLSGIKSLLLGSVSHELVHHTDRAVLIVPSPGE
jgi:nucleotide-binding universal stress UspA family protein